MEIRKRLNGEKKLSEFIRFGMVGVVATAVHYGVFYALLPLMEKNIAYTAGYLVSFVCNFIMSSLFTFRVKPTLLRLTKFGTSHVINYVLQMLLFNLVCLFGVPVHCAPLFVYAIAVPVNFFIVRFAMKKDPAPEST